MQYPLKFNETTKYQHRTYTIHATRITCILYYINVKKRRDFQYKKKEITKAKTKTQK